MYYIFGSCWLSWVTALTASLVGLLSTIPCQPVKTPASCSQGRQCPLGTRLEAFKAPYLGIHVLARVFRGRACTGGWRESHSASHERKNGGRPSRSAKLKRQEACAKILHATAGTEAKGGRQPLSARDMDKGMGTRRMLATAAIVRFVCRWHPRILAWRGLSFPTRSFSGRWSLECV
jgi:hypothetical protein